MENLISLLTNKASTQATKTAFTYLTETNETISYLQLLEKAKKIAANLQQTIDLGDRVLLILAPGLDYIASFFGIIFAGAIAVPVYPPDVNNLAFNLQLIENIASDAGIKLVITSQDFVKTLKPFVNNLPTLSNIIWVDLAKFSTNFAWQDPQTPANKLATLIYTSGSTGIPKGVMLSHRNLLHNAEIITLGTKLSSNDKFSTWVPPYHVSGLFAGIIWPLYLGTENIIFAPLTFLAKPIQWLKTISDYKVVMSGAPNFAYELCNNVISDLEIADLDLSSWKVAITGGEAIRKETIEKFIKKFTSVGFNAKSFYPMFGLTESTMISTGGTKETPLISGFSRKELEKNQAIETTETDDLVYLVGSGQPLKDMSLRVVNPETYQECQANEIGEIWVSGPSVAQGYWQRPSETIYSFQAELLNDSSRKFLRTGDLGFIHKETLFITGRLKEMIIIRGINHYPEDIEKTLRSSFPNLNTCAAFSLISNEGENLATALELELFDKKEVLVTARKVLALKHGIQLHSLFILPTGKIPKTRTGKIQRNACSKLALSTEWQDFLFSSSTKPEKEIFNKDLLSKTKLNFSQKEITHLLQKKFSQLLAIPLDEITLTQPIATLGIDSLAAVKIIANFHSDLDLQISISCFFDQTSITDLAKLWIDKVEKNKSVENKIDVLKETILEPNIQGQEIFKALPSKPKILLTGATGFLGSFLLADLLKQTETTLYCLVREKSKSAAKEKLINKLKSIKKWEENFTDKIVVVLGNLAEKNLGLSDSDYQDLSNSIDLIYHNAASVNFIAPYNTLKKENVNSLVEILKLACKEKLKAVHFVSTLAVFNSFERNNFARLKENYSTLDVNLLFSGYAQSKWIAEKILEQAQERKIPVNIYRPGLITGDSKTGFWNRDDFFCRLIKGIIELGFFPEIDLDLGLTPVDYVSQAITYISLQQNYNTIFHLTSDKPLRFQELINWMIDFGYKISPTSYKDWLEKLWNSPQNSLYPLIPFLSEKISEKTFLEIFAEKHSPKFDCQNTLTSLNDSKIKCADNSPELLNIYFSYLIKSAFLPNPKL